MMLSAHPRIAKLSLIDSELIPNIDLWHLDLDQITPQEQAHAIVHLSQQELERAYRYYRSQDKSQFILRRLLLKQVLASYDHLEPIDIQLEEDRYKKPHVLNGSKLRFNVSHTPTQGIIAVHPKDSVGVDIEQISAIEDRALDQFASLDEKRWVHTSVQRFFMLWTIKEALLKCQGTGFLGESVPPLDQIPEQILENLYVARCQEYIIYSTLWEKNWISVCRPDG
jgi:phosphopantetheinyl transferase